MADHLDQGVAWQDSQIKAIHQIGNERKVSDTFARCCSRCGSLEVFFRLAISSRTSSGMADNYCPTIEVFLSSPSSKSVRVPFSIRLVDGERGDLKLCGPGSSRTPTRGPCPLVPSHSRGHPMKGKYCYCQSLLGERASRTGLDIVFKLRGSSRYC
jgi:hypothetical protein